MITIATLIAAGIAPTQARIFAEPLAAACARFGINTPARIGALVGQCAVESSNFTRLEEGLYYTTPERIRSVFSSRVPNLQVAATLARDPEALANRVYADRLGNGDEASGDGWRYRGRGLIQLTGKANYIDAADSLVLPLVTRPQMLAMPACACMSAALYFHAHKLHLLADSAQWDAITRAVNGRAMLHADLRRQMSQDAVAAFA